MKRLAAAATLLCLVTPAVAFDADPASFRADPHAWVRNTLMPTCKAPTEKDAAACACMVPLLAARTTEADVARINDADFQKAFFKTALGAGLMCHREIAR